MKNIWDCQLTEMDKILAVMKLIKTDSSNYLFQKSDPTVITQLSRCRSFMSPIAFNTIQSQFSILKQIGFANAIQKHYVSRLSD